MCYVCDSARNATLRIPFTSDCERSRNTTAVAEKMAALKTVDYLEDRARRGDRERFLAVLARVPDVPPEPGDET